jgi:hypothetical protein
VVVLTLAVWAGLLAAGAAIAWIWWAKVGRPERVRALAAKVGTPMMRLWAGCGPFASGGVSALYLEAACRTAMGEEKQAEG